jgi:hypothetical protein
MPFIEKDDFIVERYFGTHSMQTPSMQKALMVLPPFVLTAFCILGVCTLVWALIVGNTSFCCMDTAKVLAFISFADVYWFFLL